LLYKARRSVANRSDSPAMARSTARALRRTQLNREGRWFKCGDAVKFLRVRVPARDVACVQTVNGLLVEGVRGCWPATNVLRAGCFD
jgi:hypothetical protein